MDTVREYTCPSCKAFIEVQEGLSTCTCPGCKKKYLIRKTEEGDILHEVTRPGFFRSTVSPFVQYVITAAVIVVFACAAYFYILDLSNVIPGIDEYLPSADQTADAEEASEESASPGSLVMADPFQDVTILFRGVNGSVVSAAPTDQPTAGDSCAATLRQVREKRSGSPHGSYSSASPSKCR
ncbi:MAG: hypothetical protein II628_07740, partial [Lachnospiraceae bacterium]|nr:hypothetical protein [Lachnospiraceae bacterium]